MRPLWKGVGERPDTTGLYDSIAAEVLFTVGILTSWIGGRLEIKNAHETAKDLITDAITYYESVGDTKKVAEAHAEIACGYLRQGALDEARIILNEAIKKLTTAGPTKARALLRLAIVEWSASRYTESLRILTENVSLFERIGNHSVKGTYHNQLAVVLEEIAASEKRDEYFRKAITEYGKAEQHFKLAHNTPFRANVQNNLGYLLYKLSRFQDAHRYLEEARRLAISIKDKVGAAQIDRTRAQVFMGQRKFKEAEATARSAVFVLERSGQQGLLADAMITHGIALAQLKTAGQSACCFPASHRSCSGSRSL